MRLLAIDTANRYCSAAMLDRTGADDSLHAVRRDVGRGHAEQLFAVIDETLQNAAVARRDIDRIAVNIGPGSFTGMRVGVAAARGLALALGCDCIGVSALEALAFECPAPPGKHILVMIDAGRGEVVTQLFDAKRRDPLALAETHPAEAAGYLCAGLDGTAIGSGVPPALAGTSTDWPDIAAIARLAARRGSSAAPVPFYARPPDAKPQASLELVAV